MANWTQAGIDRAERRKERARMLFESHGFITIDEFCDIAMMSRKTFYRHLAKTPEAFPPAYQLTGPRMLFKLAEVEAWASERLTRFTPTRARARRAA